MFSLGQLDAFELYLAANQGRLASLRTQLHMSEEDAIRWMKGDYLAAKLLKDDPSLGITAHAIARDIVSGDYADELVASGTPPSKALWYVGSYARFGWAVKNLPWAQLVRQLPVLWRGADPDDTDPAFLQLWYRAWVQKGCRYLRDDKPLPRGRWLTVYRGQERGDGALGIAWTTDLEIARGFARGRGLRQGHRDGVVWTGKVQRALVLGYLTGRGESEVVVNPALVLEKRVLEEARVS